MTYLLNELLQSSAETHPNGVAIVDGDRHLSYAALEVFANQIAHLLSGSGVERGDRVGIYAKKSIEAVAGAYGAMKAGAAYVPLDPEAPSGRIAYIINDCDIRYLITRTEKAGAWPALVAASPQLSALVVLDEAQDVPAVPAMNILTLSDVESQVASVPSVRSIDLDLAVILYTSGSTGNPKGVMLSHANVVTFVEWAAQEFHVTSDDRLSQIAPLHFDLSTFDLFGAALVGASVHLAQRKTTVFPIEMRRFIEEARISMVYAVPSVLTMLTERANLQPGDLSSLETILFAGEVFPTKYLSKLMRALPHVAFANLYGPTETNVCTFFRVQEPPSETDPPISIGRAIANVETFVVKDDGFLADPGEIGELHVRGATVMQGYWGDPERTAEVRVENSFHQGVADPVYRTGDLVVEEDNGNYTFLGRRDNQIKSRGYRIELGEIESALYAHSDVRECAAVAIPDEHITNRIKAYVVAGNELGLSELSRFVSERVPAYMVPGEFELRSNLPKTSTGKIDRQALLVAAQGEDRA